MRTSFLIFISLVFVMGSLNGCGDDPAAPAVILTVRGKGYMFTADAELNT